MASPVEQAIALLHSGGLVAIPTETVYGLAADAENELAVRRIFAVKGRPSSHPVIVHLPEPSALAGWARDVSAEARALAEAFWPGPLTLILRRGPRALDVVTGGQDTVGLRVPDHPLTRELLRGFGGGVAAPSANRFGAVSPTTADHVRGELGGEVDLVLDGGPCRVGVESTIVDLSASVPAVLRPGAITPQQLERVLGSPVRTATTGSTVRAPGLLPSHYAPRAGLYLVAQEEVSARIATLAERATRIALMAAEAPPLPSTVEHVPMPVEPAAFARKLYATLRDLDARGFEVIVAVPPAETGLGIAVRDRLRRAAAPRS